MRAQPFFAVLLVLSSIACNKDSGVFSPAVLQPATSAQDNHTSQSSFRDSEDPNSPLRTSCVELTTEYWLNATGAYLPPKMPAPQEGQIPGPEYGSYIIEAHGDAISKLLARGITDLTMVLHTGTYQLDGQLHTSFYFGEELEIYTEGVAEVRYQNQEMFLHVSISDATLNSGKGILEFTQGQIDFTLPAVPVGNFTINAYSDITFCHD